MIDKLVNFIRPTQSTIYDTESLTSLESVGKVIEKVNLCIQEFNNLENKTNEDYNNFRNEINSFKTSIEKICEDLTKDNNSFKNEFKELIKNIKDFRITLDYIKTQSEYIQNLAKINQDNIDKGVIATKDEINNINISLEEKASKTDLQTQKDRIDSFTKLAEGSTTGDAELIDGRVAYDGITYSNIGNAIRGQISNINNILFLKTVNLWRAKYVKHGGYYINDTFLTDSEKWNVSDFMEVEPNTMYYFQPFDMPSKKPFSSILICFDENKNWIGNVKPASDNEFAGNGAKFYTTLANTKYIRLQYEQTLDSYKKFQFSKASNWTGTYIPEFKLVTEKYTEEYAEKYTEEVRKNTIIYNNNDTFQFNYVNGSPFLGYSLTSYANGLCYDKEVTVNRKPISDSTYKLSHDSTLNIDKNGIGYIFSCVNKTDYGDNPHSLNAFVELDIIDVKTLSTSSSLTKYEVAKNGDTVGNMTIISGCGIPNAVLIGNNLYCMFSAKLSNGEWYWLTRIFNIANNTFGNIQICSIWKDGISSYFTTKNVNTNITTITNTDVYVGLNAQFSLNPADNKYYCCATFNGEKAIILKTSDFINYEFVFEPSFTNTVSGISEGACCFFNNKLYFGLRQNNEKSSYYCDRKMLIGRIDIASKSIEEETMIPDAMSRSMFLIDGNNLYLCHSILARKIFEIVKIKPSSLNDSYVVLQGQTQGIYPSIVKYNNEYYISSTENGLRVSLRKFSNIEKYSYGEIANKIASLLFISKDL